MAVLEPTTDRSQEPREGDLHVEKARCIESMNRRSFFGIDGALQMLAPVTNGSQVKETEVDLYLVYSPDLHQRGSL